MSGISKMDLRALRYFVHVAEARSFSKAAVQLRIAQPALSRQIRKLEDEVGLALILRTRRQLELTDAGLLLLQRAHSLLRQAAQTADDVRAHGSRVQGTLTLGVSPTICEALVPRIVRECAALGFSLPEPGCYGVGMMFLPVEPKQRLICEGIVERVAKEEGLTVLGWRDTPVHGDAIGRTARATQPRQDRSAPRSCAAVNRPA